MTPQRFWYIVGYTFQWFIVVLVIYGVAKIALTVLRGY